MTLRSLDPVSANHLLDQGGILVDIREADEHAREKIPGAYHLPLSKLDEAKLDACQRIDSAGAPPFQS